MTWSLRTFFICAALRPRVDDIVLLNGQHYLLEHKTAGTRTLRAYTMLLYGTSKAGKNTFCATAQEALFLATEPGLNALEVFQVSITEWDDMLQACAEIAEGKHQFKTIIIDTIDNAYKMCADHMCKKSGVDQRAEALGMSLISVTARATRSSTTRSGRPTPFPAGAQQAGLPALRPDSDLSRPDKRGGHGVGRSDTRTGKIMRTVPTLPDKARKIVVGLVDMILYCDLETVKGEDGKSSVQRVLRTKPHLSYDAGDRTGRLPEVLPMNYPAFVETFEKAVPTAVPTAVPVSTEVSSSLANTTNTTKPANAAKKDA